MSKYSPELQRKRAQVVVDLLTGGKLQMVANDSGSVTHEWPIKPHIADVPAEGGSKIMAVVIPVTDDLARVTGHRRFTLLLKTAGGKLAASCTEPWQLHCWNQSNSISCSNEKMDWEK